MFHSFNKAFVVSSLFGALFTSMAATAETLAYWRFEGAGEQLPVAGQQVEDSNGRTTTNTGQGIRAVDVSGNGNHLWAWEHAWAGFTYQPSVAQAVLPQTGEANRFSVQNAGGYPAMNTWSKASQPGHDIEVVTPRRWTIEASIMQTSTGGYQTFVGRDGNRVGSTAAAAPLYFQSRDGRLAIQFTDMAGNTYTVTDRIGAMAANQWHNVAAVSDGGTLWLYRDSGEGYQMVGSTSLRPEDSRLAYAMQGASETDDNQWGWTLGRGRYSNAESQFDGHTDRFKGFIDEVRISDEALAVNQLLFSTPEPEADDSYFKAGTVNLLIMPDTQKVARYDARIYDSQTQWIADNADRLDIAMVNHLGDVVDRHDQDYEWREASEAMAILEDAGIPYSLLPGNHDVSRSWQWDTNRSGWQEKYFTYFNSARAMKNMKTFGARDNVAGYSEYHLLEAEGIDFLILSLGWNSSSSTLQWASDVINSYPNRPVILLSHQILDIAADEKTPIQTDYGQYVWDELIATHDQIFLTLNGHHHGTARQVVNNNSGNPVVMMVVDYQSEFHGGNGLMRYLQLDINDNEISSIDFSPWALVMEQFGETQTHLDDPLMTGDQQTFTMDFDLQQRFSQIMGTPLTIPVVTAEQVDPAELWLSELQAAKVVDEPESNPASSQYDYPRNGTTLAHWRFDRYPAGMAVPSFMPLQLDISGWNNQLMRSNTATPSHGAMVFSSDHHAGSASKGSVCMSGDAGGAFLQTMQGSRLGFETFPNGYTIEAFFKISPEWDSSNDKWTGIFAQHGDGAGTAKWGGDQGEPQANLAISSLREIFWSLWPDNKNDRDTSWSWTIGRGQWHHAAAVNKNGKVTLYIDGVTDFRNPGWTDAIGIAPNMSGKGYLIGANVSGNSYSIFNGCIGEVRVSAKALEPNEFLFNRAN